MEATTACILEKVKGSFSVSIFAADLFIVLQPLANENAGTLLALISSALPGLFNDLDRGKANLSYNSTDYCVSNGH